MSPWKRSKKDKEEETSRWWFSDEDLQEAIANIVDVVPPKRGHGRHAEPPDTEDEEQDNGE
jgi:hypothetical protein